MNRPAKSRAKRPTTKKAQLIRLLSARSGADIEAISKKLGWQNHAMRAAIAGLKNAGYTVRANKEGGRATRYRILADPEGANSDSRPTVSKADKAPEPANAR